MQLRIYVEILCCVLFLCVCFVFGYYPQYPQLYPDLIRSDAGLWIKNNNCYFCYFHNTWTAWPWDEDAFHCGEECVNQFQFLQQDEICRDNFLSLSPITFLIKRLSQTVHFLVYLFNLVVGSWNDNVSRKVISCVNSSDNFNKERPGDKQRPNTDVMYSCTEPITIN